MLAVRMGSHLSKIVGPALTPWLIGKAGWRTASRIYGVAFGCYAVLWQLTARERPRAVDLQAQGGGDQDDESDDDDDDDETASRADLKAEAASPSPTAAKLAAASPPSLPPPFTLRLLTVRSQIAINFSPVCHDLLEFQVRKRLSFFCNAI
jgi:hypothetical protein